MTKQEKARRSFDYACKQASKCRHERYQVSCASCSDEKTCEIQERVRKNLKILRQEMGVPEENTDPIAVTP